MERLKQSIEVSFRKNLYRTLEETQGYLDEFIDYTSNLIVTLSPAIPHSLSRVKRKNKLWEGVWVVMLNPELILKLVREPFSACLVQHLFYRFRNEPVLSPSILLRINSVEGFGMTKGVPERR